MWIAITLSCLIVLLSYSIIPTYWYKLKMLWKRKPMREKIIYLTFDDGPDINYTEHLLDVLNKNKVKASFFVVASFAKDNPKIIKRMKQEGHTIGLHSLSHKNGMVQTPRTMRDDFGKSMEIMKELGVSIKFFRPPWGHFNLETLRLLKKYQLQPVLWNVMAQDWEGNTTSKIIEKKLLQRVKNGDTICLHDGRGSNEAPSRTIAALEEALPKWLAMGYQFITVEEQYETKVRV